MKCQHYNTCINSNESLCGDIYCSINRIQTKKEQKQQYEEVVQCLEYIKKELGINSFLELNNK